MAILGDIRRHTWLLIIVVGFAMFAFVAGDLFSENSVFRHFFGGDPNEVGSIDGQTISLAEFVNAQNAMRSNPNLSQNQLTDQVWNMLVSQKLIRGHAEKAGLEVNDAEVWEYLAQQYGMTDAEELKTQIGMLKGQAQQRVQGAGEALQNFYNSFEEVKPNILNQKYMELVTMAIATTSVDAELQQKSNIQTATFDYAYATYEDLEKRYDVQVTDSEIENYIKKYPKSFQSKAVVDLSFVYFPSAPSADDEANVLKEVESFLTTRISRDTINNIVDTIQGFASVTNDSIYVSRYSDRGFMDQYFTRKDIEQFASQLPEDYADFLMTASVGQVGGPFRVGESYQLAKISSSEPIVDSINSSHILISYSGTDVAGRQGITRSREEARALADSLYMASNENPGNFGALIQQFSDDEGSKVKGGNIGWTSSTSPNIAAEYLQFLNSHTTGEIGVTESKFGFHIIRIDGIKNAPGYQIASIVKEIKPSQDTSDKNFADARNFATEVQGKSLNDFANLAQEKGYNYTTAENVNRYYNAPLLDPSFGVGNDSDDDILKWAFASKAGESNLFTTPREDRIIVFISSKASAGLASPSSVRAEVEPIIVEQKLNTMISEKLGDQPTLAAFVSNFGAHQGTATTTFGNAQVEGMGEEPKVAGAAFGIKEGEVSKPISGNTGIFVISLKSKTAEPTVDDPSFLIDQLNTQAVQNITQGLIPSMINAADIKDNRRARLDGPQGFQ